MDMNEEFLQMLLSAFKSEGEERINNMSSCLVQLEKEDSEEKRNITVETIYREAHSLKGAARAVNLISIESLCHSMENIFSLLKNNKLSLHPEMFDIFHKTVDTMWQLLSSPEGIDISGIIQELECLKRGEIKKIKKPDISTEILENIEKDKKPVTEISEKRENDKKSLENISEKYQGAETVIKDIETGSKGKTSSETVRIAAAKLDKLMLQAEELLSVKFSARQNSLDLKDIKDMIILWKKEVGKIRPDIKSLSRVSERKDKRKFSTYRIIEFLEWNNKYMNSFESKISDLLKLSLLNSRSVTFLVDNLLEEMKKTLMLPFSSITASFPKMVRDISRARDKEVELFIEGSEIEIDRRILEEMKTPLIHLLRNSIDHGIENPSEREKKNKNRTGTIKISLSQIDTGKVSIIISDDGSGIDIERIKSAAIKKGIISDVSLKEDEILSLIFQADISASPIITDISGRGLGMTIVRESVEKMGGHITAESNSDKGTIFKIILPITIATFRGTLVLVSGREFIIPAMNMQMVLRIKKDDIKTIENRETVMIDKKTVPLVYLSDILELPGSSDENKEFITLLILYRGDRTVAFIADEIVTEQEVLVKSLGKQLSRVRNISGATISVTGKVIPILNISDLIKSAVKIIPSQRIKEREERKEENKSILVADDSVTSRILVKNILEASGYDVKTAVDGMDAYRVLREEDFHLVVSDVEMPRMNGFELTEKIRSDKKLSEMPVILLTALSSREDRERGIDVGASAYIVKSTFDQTGLLNVVKKLI
jgi:two-component system chemotaxis sensor kinase CheA